MTAEASCRLLVETIRELARTRAELGESRGLGESYRELALVAVHQCADLNRAIRRQDAVLASLRQENRLLRQRHASSREAA